MLREEYEEQEMAWELEQAIAQLEEQEEAVAALRESSTNAPATAQRASASSGAAGSAASSAPPAASLMALSIKELKARCPPHVNTSGMEKKELVQLVLEAVTEAAETPPQDRGTSSSSSSSPSSSIPGPEASHVALTAEQQVRVQPSELSSTPPPPCFQMIDDPCPYVARR